MAAVGVNNNFVLNIVELQNVITNVGGITATTSLSNAVANIQEMVIYDEKRIATNTISNYNTTPIQVTASLNMASGTEFTLNGSAVTNASTSQGQFSTVGNGPSYMTFVSTVTAGASAITFVANQSTVASITTGGLFSISGAVRLSGTGTPLAGRYLTCMDTVGTAEWHDPGSVPSDARLKENIRPVTDYGTVLETIRGVRFDWISTGAADIGVIAQEVHEVLPEAVEQNGGDMMRVSYHKIIPVLVEAIKDLRARVSTLEA